MPPQPPPSTLPTATGLTAIDECMVQSYQALIQNAPKALTEGQEITLKIGTWLIRPMDGIADELCTALGKGTDGKYYFENQLQNVRELSLIAVSR